MATITNPMFGDATTGAALASAIGDGQVGDTLRYMDFIGARHLLAEDPSAEAGD